MSDHVGISIIDWSGERVYIMCVSVCLSMSTMVPVDVAMCLSPLSRHWSHLVRLGDYNLLTRCWECSHTSPRTRTDKTVAAMRGGGKAIIKDVVKAAGIFKMTSSRSFNQQHSILTRLNPAECEAIYSLKDLVSIIFLIPYFPLTDDLDHQWKSCFVWLPLNKAPLTLFFLFYIKGQSEEQDWAKNTD